MKCSHREVVLSSAPERLQGELDQEIDRVPVAVAEREVDRRQAGQKSRLASVLLLFLLFFFGCLELYLESILAKWTPAAV